MATSLTVQGPSVNFVFGAVKCGILLTDGLSRNLAQRSMSLIRNERVKLTATWLNTLAAATIVTGVLAPTVALVFGFSTSGTVSAGLFAGATAVWLLIGGGLHMAARHLLGRLQE
jgi:hypothetical protein